MSLHNIHCVWLKTLQLTLAEEYNSIPFSVLTPVGGRQERHMACKKICSNYSRRFSFGDAANPGVNAQKNASETIRTESERRIFKYTIKKLLSVTVSISVELLMVSGKAHYQN